MMDLLQMTTAELTAKLEEIERGAEGAQRQPFRSWQMNRDRLDKMYNDATKIILELARRGVKKPGAGDPDSDLLKDIRHLEGLVESGDRVHWNRMVLVRLLELLSYRRLVRRQELTADDEIREYENWHQAMATGTVEEREKQFRHGQVRGSYLAGLRRGFVMRAEERA